MEKYLKTNAKLSSKTFTSLRSDGKRHMNSDEDHLHERVSKK